MEARNLLHFGRHPRSPEHGVCLFALLLHVIVLRSLQVYRYIVDRFSARNNHPLSRRRTAPFFRRNQRISTDKRATSSTHRKGSTRILPAGLRGRRSIVRQR